MTQDTVVTRILETEIMPHPLIPVDACEDIVKSLERAWCAGYEYGRASKNTDRPVSQCDETGRVLSTHPSITVAARRHNISRECISLAVNGKQKTAAGFIWRYAEVG